MRVCAVCGERLCPVTSHLCECVSSRSRVRGHGVFTCCGERYIHVALLCAAATTGSVTV